MGISWQIGARRNYDKSFIHLPGQGSFTINQTFANWGRVGHKTVERLANTTVLTTNGKDDI